jgi:hypothetical protein
LHPPDEEDAAGELETAPPPASVVPEVPLVLPVDVPPLPPALPAPEPLPPGEPLALPELLPAPEPLEPLLPSFPLLEAASPPPSSPLSTAGLLSEPLSVAVDESDEPASTGMVPPSPSVSLQCIAMQVAPGHLQSVLTVQVLLGSGLALGATQALF